MKNILTIFTIFAFCSTIFAQNWTTSGNAITDPNTEYLGTTSAQDLVIKTGGTEAMRINSAQRVGIGTTNPQNALHISGGTLGGLRLSNLINAPVLATNANGDIIAGVAASLYANGDVKYAMLSADHSGWFLMNGTSYAAHGLNASQIAVANGLGFGGSLPNAFDKYLSQVTAGALGSLSGNTGNIVTLAQANLPNVTLSGTTSSNGVHTHTERFPTSLSGTAFFGPIQFFNNAPLGSGNTSSDGAHTHTITTSSINGGVAQTAVNIKPHTIKANAFVYLGL